MCTLIRVPLVILGSDARFVALKKSWILSLAQKYSHMMHHKSKGNWSNDPSKRIRTDSQFEGTVNPGCYGHWPALVDFWAYFTHLFTKD